MNQPCVFAGMYMRLNHPRIMTSANVPGHSMEVLTSRPGFFSFQDYINVYSISPKM